MSRTGETARGEGGGKAFGVRRHSEHGERGRQGRERERITYPMRIPPVDVGPGTEGALHTLEVIVLRGIIQLPEGEGERERERWDEGGRGGGIETRSEAASQSRATVRSIWLQ